MNKFYVLELSDSGVITINGMETKGEVSAYLLTKYPTDLSLSNAKESGKLLVTYGHFCTVKATESISYEIID